MAGVLLKFSCRNELVGRASLPSSEGIEWAECS